MSNQDLLLEFQKEYITEASFLLEQCEESFLNLEKNSNREEELAKIYRVIHTFKGAGAAVGFSDIAQFTHIVEDSLSILRLFPYFLTPEIISLLLKVADSLKSRISYLSTGGRNIWEINQLTDEMLKVRDYLKIKSKTVEEEFKNRAEKSSEVKDSLNVKQSDREIFVNQESAQHPKKNESLSSSSSFRSVVKVDSDRIDNVLDAVGELVVIKSQLMNEIQVSSMHHSKLSDIVSLLDRTIRELQDKALSMRMTPIKSIFLKAQRIVRDLSLKLNKEVKFDMQGEDVELDRVMVETISDPLMHLLRNCLDHGIEDHEERLKKNKNPVGLIQLKAQAIGSRIIIQIKDDGGGIKREKIINKAVEKGFIKSSAEAHSLSDNEIFQFIFKPGFSTAECVTDVSGRGVGMDVVKTNIDKVRGSIQIESSIDLGTLFTLSLPLTSSITEGLLINVNKHPYIISIDNVVELIDENQFQSTTLPTGEKVLCLRDKFFPVLDLRQVYYKKNIGSLQLSRSAENSLEEFQSSIDELIERPSSVILVESQGVVFAIMMNEVLGQTQVVQKSISNYINVNQTGLSGAAILGNGRVALVIDIEELLKSEVLRVYSKNSLQKISTQSKLINKKG